MKNEIKVFDLPMQVHYLPTEHLRQKFASGQPVAVLPGKRPAELNDKVSYLFGNGAHLRHAFGRRKINGRAHVQHALPRVTVDGYFGVVAERDLFELSCVFAEFTWRNPGILNKSGRFCISHSSAKQSDSGFTNAL